MSGQHDKYIYIIKKILLLTKSDNTIKKYQTTWIDDDDRSVSCGRGIVSACPVLLCICIRNKNIDKEEEGGGRTFREYERCIIPKIAMIIRIFYVYLIRKKES